MTVTGYPFENQDTTETQFSYLMRELQDPGVIGSFGDASLAATGAGTTMHVNIATGRAFIRGFVGEVTAAHQVAGTAASAAARVDRVAMRVDPSANTVNLVHLPGTSGSSTPPALTQTDTGVYDIPLVRFPVAPGQTGITTASLIDERPWVGHRVGVWTTEGRPASPRLGRLGWNTTTSTWEFWNGATWANLSPTNLSTDVLTSGTLPIARGGTGATTAALARAALGITLANLGAQPAGSYQPAGDYSLNGHNHDGRYWTTSQSDGRYATAGHGHVGSYARSIVGQDIGLYYHNSGHPYFHVDGSEFPIASQAWVSANFAGAGGTATYAEGPTGAAYNRNAVGTGFRTVWMNAQLQFMQNTSSIRYKENVQDLGVDARTVLDALRPVTFDRIGGETVGEAGFIAEDLLPLPGAAYRDEDDQVDGYYDRAVLAAMAVVLHDLDARLTAAGL